MKNIEVISLSTILIICCYSYLLFRRNISSSSSSFFFGWRHAINKTETTAQIFFFFLLLFSIWDCSRLFSFILFFLSLSSFLINLALVFSRRLVYFDSILRPRVLYSCVSIPTSSSKQQEAAAASRLNACCYLSLKTRVLRSPQVQSRNGVSLPTQK